MYNTGLQSKIKVIVHHSKYTEHTEYIRTENIIEQNKMEQYSYINSQATSPLIEMTSQVICLSLSVFTTLGSVSKISTPTVDRRHTTQIIFTLEVAFCQKTVSS